MRSAYVYSCDREQVSQECAYLRPVRPKWDPNGAHFSGHKPGGAADKDKLEKPGNHRQEREKRIEKNDPIPTVDGAETPVDQKKKRKRNRNRKPKPDLDSAAAGDQSEDEKSDHAVLGGDDGAEVQGAGSSSTPAAETVASVPSYLDMSSLYDAY
jgi:hypothetical protein